MKYKTVFIFLIIMTMFTNVIIGAIGYKTTSATFDENDADLPIWNIGDSWTYDMRISGEYIDSEFPEMNFNLNIDDMEFEVISEDETTYHLSVNARITGNGRLGGIISGNLQDTTLSGYVNVNKADLALISFESLKVLGRISILQIDVDIIVILFDPIFQSYDFPMNVGESWTVPTHAIWLEAYVNKPDLSAILPPELYMYPWIFEHELECEKIENKLGWVSLKVTGDLVDYWYSPDAKNTVYAKNNNPINMYSGGNEEKYYRLTTFELTLTDSSYEPPNYPPEIPEKPSSDETEYYANVEYSFETSASDPNFHDVKYGFDWGDSSEVTWTGLVDSGDTASAQHIYLSEGTYNVKAKTQDELGAESDWSEILTVNIAPNSLPDKPDTPDGQTTGNKGTSYPYVTSTSDADDDQVYYWFDWGDGSNSGWLGPYVSDVEVSKDNSWSDEGDYQIKVKAKDEHGAESEWSDPLSISMPRNRNLIRFKLIEILDIILEKFPIFERILGFF